MVDRTAQHVAALEKRVAELEATMHGLLVALASAQAAPEAAAPAEAVKAAEKAEPDYPKLSPGRNDKA